MKKIKKSIDQLFALKIAIFIMPMIICVIAIGICLFRILNTDSLEECKVDIFNMFTSIISMIISIIPSVMEKRRKTNEKVMGLKRIKEQEKNKERFKKERTHDIYRIDIIEKLSKAQFKENTTALISVTFCLAVCLYLRTILAIEINETIPIVMIILAWLIAIKQILLAYRVKKKYYGTNYEEARELLRFIKQSKDDDPHSGKYVFNDEKQDVPVAGKLVEYE